MIDLTKVTHTNRGFRITNLRRVPPRWTGHNHGYSPYVIEGDVIRDDNTIYQAAWTEEGYFHANNPKDDIHNLNLDNQ